ncbi:MFS transporter [Agaricicola taiwanensis]|uniref:MFS transporter n=1 Tax=Agaricicola taiwanensis TaxID=591372 RepID=A0A8J2YMS3_9RHOB|nr:indolepyruvate ferredoxin oxidoreductase family protein [Agaricicola taiwanensis]GGE52951.1 MFS transporter [Agaricicola taiwanensis]
MGESNSHLRDVNLDDKYDLTKDEIFVTGYQAAVRLTLMQRERDRRAGLNTAGYISGYRGSPLGGLDLQFMKARKVLEPQNILIQPGLNEDLAATAVWGSQQAEMRGEGRYDGVFGMWYGKGPGVDRSGDVLRHANLAGSSKFGGVIALMGDDHTCESSTTAHQSDFHFVDVMIPVLAPAGVQEILDFGLYGWAMSRFAGVWVGIKCLKDTVESTAVVDGRVDRINIALPEFAMPEGGLNIRPFDTPLAQEARLQEFKRDAMMAFLEANPINRIITHGGRRPRIGIAAVGKSYLDLRQALDDLGIDEVAANNLGLRIWKIGCPWPMQTKALYDFARDLDLVMVIEEKRSLIEVQVREELYRRPTQPVVIGKKDEEGHWLFPVKGALDPNDVAIALGERILRYHDSEELRGRLHHLREVQRVLATTQDVAVRVPYFCAGCPHNSSTKVPEGERAYAGIGCHYMVQWMDRDTEGFTQMGGEGVNWVGEAPFSTRNHVFQNLGDGTFNHSGVLAIRAAIAAKTNITYKILFNDAVAMTGGQPNEGGLTPDRIARIVAAEGVAALAVVTDDPEKYPDDTDWPKGTRVHHRDELMTVQKRLAEVPGVTAVIYDQTCAAEKRRRRKRGDYPDPDTRILINELVCEGCGDCGVQSNCVAIQPVETEFGRKRQIDQTACNKDYSCLKGFCPSFVSVHGGKLKKKAGVSSGEVAVADLPEPDLPELDERPWSVIVTGVGGTGVVTVGAILGMAAHLEGKGCGMIDMAGLAQKGGAVYSHVRLARSPTDIHAIRVEAGAADLVLGCDIVVAGNKKVLSAIKPDRTLVTVNTHETYPGTFARDAYYSLPGEKLKRSITEVAGANRVSFVDSTRLATQLFGSAVAANMFLLGLAWQKGGLPLSAEALEKAIGLNGEAVAMNVAAFRWGRRAAVDMAEVEALVGGDAHAMPAMQSLDDVVAKRVRFLTDYQSKRYARRYARRIDRLREVEQAVGAEGLAEAAARYLFKLMAYKDEYEVARLYTNGAFERQLEDTFEPGYQLEFHLAPPVLSRNDPHSGRPKKRQFGPWMMSAFRALARFRHLRGTPLDVFGYGHERRVERRLVADYEALLDDLMSGLTPANHSIAVALASLPDKIRGFGPVKAQNVAKAEAEKKALLAQFRNPPVTPLAEAAE